MTAQQNYRSLCDSCYNLLEKQDIATFKKIVPKLFDSFTKENDPYYTVSEELENKHQEDQSLRLLYMDARYLSTEKEVKKVFQDYINNMLIPSAY